MDVRINSTDKQYSEANLKTLKDNLNFISSSTPSIPLDNVKLVFTEQFTEEVEAYQNENDISLVGHSVGAVAKVCHFVDSDDILNTTVFFDLSTFHPVLEFTATECPYEIHYIQHELGHVYDDHLMHGILPESYFEQDSLTKTEGLLYQLADIAWSEFQANKISVGTVKEIIHISQSIEILIKIFVDSANDVGKFLFEFPDQVDEIKEEILNDEGNCLSIQHYTKDLLYNSSQFIGIVLAFGLDDEESPLKKQVYDEALNEFRKLDFETEFEELLYIFKDLQQTYPKWENFYALEPITKWIKRFWYKIGVVANDHLLFFVI